MKITTGLYGIQVHDRGYVYVPFKWSMLDAHELLRHMCQSARSRSILWIADEELFYPGKAQFSVVPHEPSFPVQDWNQAILAKEAIHEVGHVLG